MAYAPYLICQVDEVLIVALKIRGVSIASIMFISRIVLEIIIIVPVSRYYIPWSRAFSIPHEYVLSDVRSVSTRAP